MTSMPEALGQFCSMTKRGQRVSTVNNNPIDAHNNNYLPTDLCRHYFLWAAHIITYIHPSILSRQELRRVHDPWMIASTALLCPLCGPCHSCLAVCRFLRIMMWQWIYWSLRGVLSWFGTDLHSNQTQRNVVCRLGMSGYFIPDRSEESIHSW